MNVCLSFPSFCLLFLSNLKLRAISLQPTGFAGRGGFGGGDRGFGRDQRTGGRPGGDFERREKKYEEFKAPEPGRNLRFSLAGTVWLGLGAVKLQE